MTTAEPILLYTAKICPYAARAELALEEAGVPWERYEIDLLNKPEWYESKVNKASKVPVLVTGKDSADEFKIPESLVIVEYIADLYDGKLGDNSLLPKDPKQRALARYLTERFAQLVTSQYVAVRLHKDVEALPKIIEGLKSFQEIIDKQGPYALGSKYSVADLAISPFVARILSSSKHDLLPSGSVKIHEAFEQDPSLERLRSWWSAVTSRPSWSKTWDESTFVADTKKRFAKS